jgi:hypothetical protein
MSGAPKGHYFIVFFKYFLCFAEKVSNTLYGVKATNNEVKSFMVQVMIFSALLLLMLTFNR